MRSPLPITLYIPCYNAAAFLDRVLPAVAAQSYPVDRAFIVDDGSTDATAAIAERHGFEIVRHEGNRGLGCARNTGGHAATTDYVACLDADVVPRPDWLERLAANFDDGAVIGASGQLHESVLDSVADRWRDAHMRQSWGPDRIENPKFLYGNNGLYLKQALCDAGLYDESCRTNGEDVTMSANLRELGLRVVYDPTAECEHLRSDDVESICRTFWNWHTYGASFDDADDVARLARVGRKLLLRRFLPADLRAGHVDLAALCAYMWVDWRRRLRRAGRA